MKSHHQKFSTKCFCYYLKYSDGKNSLDCFENGFRFMREWDRDRINKNVGKSEKNFFSTES